MMNTRSIPRRWPHTTTDIGPVCTDDPLSAVLDSFSLRVRSAVDFRFHVPWGIRLQPDSICFYIVTRGQCWLSLDGQIPCQLETGDFAIVNHQQHHCLSDTPGRTALPLEQLFGSQPLSSRQKLYLNGTGDLTALIAGSFIINDDRHCPLFTALPAVIQVKAGKGQMAPLLHEFVQTITSESQQDHQGTLAMMSGFVKILLIYAIRSYLATLHNDNHNWLRVLMDPYIGPALGLMHLHPERSWSVESLAREVRMSRSAFSARFVELMGEPPMRYLLTCRMNRACQLLCQGEPSLKELASQVGYGSQAAFSNAFHRWAGCSPGDYRRTFNKTGTIF
jgi:AraC-like DNA-binding protein